MTTAASGGSPSRVDQAREMTTRALALLDEQLASGNSAQLNAFLKAVGRFHRYSFGNIMLILAQRPDATRVAGFHTWKSFGRSVKKGEKGIVVIAPMVLRSRGEQQDEHDRDDDRHRHQQPDDKVASLRLRFRAAYVFDIAQTEGQDLPEPARVGGDPGAALDRLEAAVVASGITLETSETMMGVEGYSAGGRIVLRRGQSDAERFSTLVHEWAHEILHQGDPENRPPKTVRETEAEAVAFIVGHAIGLDLNTASSDYIKLYQGDRETLAASLDRIQKTACRIIVAITGASIEHPHDRPSVEVQALRTGTFNRAGRAR